MACPGVVWIDGQMVGPIPGSRARRSEKGMRDRVKKERKKEAG